MKIEINRCDDLIRETFVKYRLDMADKTIESLKQDFIQEVMSETSFDTLKEWLYMHEEARYVASLTSKESELIEYKKEYEDSIKLGFLKKR